jgi:hypothetical protein
MTPYGVIEVSRHVYQSSQGGKTYTPLDIKSGLIRQSTPRMGKLVSSKYAELDGRQVVSDLLEDRHVSVSFTYVQDLSTAVSNILIDNELSWSYDLPSSLDLSAIQSISISRDGTTLPLQEGSWKMAMCGCFLLNDKEGTALHSIYVGKSPESGNILFNSLMDKELAHLKAQLPHIDIYQGLADGLAENWTYLSPLTTHQGLDFYHACLHLDPLSRTIARGDKIGKLTREQWVEAVQEDWKNKETGVENRLEEMKKKVQNIKNDKKKIEAQAHITYFNNQSSRMKYKQMQDLGLPIGSGKIEAACKTLVNERLAQSGMRWTTYGADDVLIVRALKQTQGRWKQTWKKISEKDKITTSN